jgi:hypothetical protein
MTKKKTQQSTRGEAIAAARKKGGDGTDWKKVFAKLDKTKGKRGR